ncbi:MAG: DUF4268 domain-containing protein [Anaerolineae bacterium]
MTIERLERVPLRMVWPNEAYGFTPWLEENLDVLGDAIGLELANAEREQAAGTFSVDLVAEDLAGNPVIIEIQLGKSDHDHLGKLLTYQVAFQASTAIWLVSDPRPEHVAVINWLNEASSGSFYMVKVEAVRIGESAPAPLLTEIVGPSEKARLVGESKREFSESQARVYAFWDELLVYARTLTDLHANISPTHMLAVRTGAGITGITFNYVVHNYATRVELYINRRDGNEIEHIFDQLYAQRVEIEERCGLPISWQRLDDKRASRIAIEIETGGYRDEHWEPIHRDMVAAMIQLEAALSPYISQLRL